MRDVDIRRQLREEMRERHGADPNTLILDEFVLCQGQARVDVVIVNGTMHGYEIKSERDTLARLPSQQDVYNRTLDYVTVVLAESHTANVFCVVPDWWGVKSAVQAPNGDIKFRTVRRGRRNPSIEPAAVAQLLWRDEVLAELEARGLAGGLRSKPRRDLWERLAQTLSAKEVGDVVRTRLRARAPTWRPRLSPPV